MCLKEADFLNFRCEFFSSVFFFFFFFFLGGGADAGKGEVKWGGGGVYICAPVGESEAKDD